MSDEKLAVRSTMLLRAMKTKVEVEFEIVVDTDDSAHGTGTVKVQTQARAKVLYGEGLNESKMGEFLTQRTGRKKEAERWGVAVRELEERLVGRGKKAA